MQEIEDGDNEMRMAGDCAAFQYKHPIKCAMAFSYRGGGFLRADEM